ncbi:MAG: hypothetical protein AAFQ59_09465, partial [Pseudomonadota bacterium]
TVNIDAGTAASLTNGAGAGTSTVTDGQVTGTTTIGGGAVVVDQTTDDADLELVGTTTVNDGSLTVTDGEVGAVINQGTSGGATEVTLTDGDIASLTNTTGDAALNGGTVTGATTVAAGTVTNAGAAITTAATSGTGTYTQSGGSATDVTNNGGTVNLAGGTANSVTNGVGATTTNISGGTVANDVTVGGGVANLTTDADVDGGLVVNAGTANVSDNTDVAGTTTVATGATLSVTGGTLAEVENNGSTNVTISGGTVANVDHNSGTTDLTGGSVTGATDVADGTVSNSGAAITTATTSGTGTYTQTGGTSTDVANNGGTVNLDGGTTATLTNGAGAGTSTVTDGQVTGTTTINGSAVVVDQATDDADLELVGTTTVNDGSLTVTDGEVGAVINQGTSGGATEVTLTDGDIASLTNTTGDAALNGGTVTGATTVADGTVTNAGAAITTASASGTGTYTQSGGSSTDVTNDGATVNIAGGTVGSLDNTDGATTISGGTVTTTTNIDAGTITQSGGTLTGAVSVNGGTLNTTGAGAVINGTTTVAMGGTLDVDNGDVSDVNNTGGTVDIANGSVNSLDNTAGTTTMTGGTIEDAVTVSGGTLTATGGTLAGSLTTSGAGTANIGTLVQGDVFNNGGTFNLNAGGDIDGTFNNNQAFTFSAGMLDDVNNTSTFDINGAQTIGGAFDNVGGTLNVESGESLTATSFDNTGTINLDGALAGNVDSTGGTINVTGSAAQINGDLTLGTGGTLSLQDAGGTDSGTAVQVSGVGTSDLSAGTLAFDVGTNGVGGVLTDTFTFAGTITGQVNLSLNIAEDVFDQSGTVSVVTAGDSAGLSFGTIDGTQVTTTGTFSGSTNGAGADVASLTVGATQYTFTNTNTGVDLTVGLAEGIGNLAAGIGLTQSVVGSIVNRPTSPYVTDYVGYTGDSRQRRLKRQASSDDPCGVGGWARVSGGTADVDGSFNLNDGNEVAATQDVNFYSIQTGGDIACFDNRFNGFDMSFGLLAGYSTGDTNSTAFVGGTNIVDTIIDTDFDQTYAGLYATASRGSFFADLQLRFENLDYEVTPTNVDVTNGTLDDVSDFSTTGTTVSGAVGYSWQIPSVEGLSFVGSAGFSYSDFETDAVTLAGTDSSGDTLNSLQLADSSVELGFVSGTLSRSRVLPDEISAINYFGTLTYYNDFADDPTATLTALDPITGLPTGAAADDLQLSNLGSYGEISLGVNYIRLLNTGGDGPARQLSAAARVDYRSGSNVDSFGITGQLRIQF